jgi:hypothetical protein
LQDGEAKPESANPRFREEADDSDEEENMET